MSGSNTTTNANLISLDYAYDQQIVRFLQQLVRAFSGFQYRTGYNVNGAPQLVIVPCTLASTNRQTASIMSNLSEATAQTCPKITIWNTGLRYRKDGLQNPYFIETLNVSERSFNTLTNTYGTEKGNQYSVQRLMARPFEMDIQVDIWTSNLDQQYQLLEQILVIVVPGIDIQNSQNPLDWTSLSTIFLEDIQLSSRSIPVGTTSTINISTLKMRLPMWLSPPAKVKTQNIIQKIITNMYNGTVEFDNAGTPITGGEILKTTIRTPGDHWINVNGNSVELLGAGDATPKSRHSTWQDLFNEVGLYRPTLSQLLLYYTDDQENGPYVSGTFQIDPNFPNKLIWQNNLTTLPANTLPAIAGVIDPTKTFPGNGLTTPAFGTYYMIVNDIAPSEAWGNLIAKENDIIEWTHNGWVVAFSSAATSTMQFVLNSYTGRQLKWTGSDWVMSIDTNYSPGYWKLIL